MTMKSTLATFAAMTLTAAAPAYSATNFFTNFDSVAVAPGTFVVLPTVEGWIATTGAGIELQNSAVGAPFSAPNLVELDSHNNTTMSRAIAAGNYTLSYYYSPRPRQPVTTNGIEALLGGTVINAISGIGGGGTAWTQYTATFTTLAPTTLSFRAVGTNDSLGGYLDDIRLSGTAVPEASTWAMMIVGFGFAGLGLRLRSATAVAA